MHENTPILVASPGSVDLWLTWLKDVQVPTLLTRYNSLLNAEEIDRHSRFYFEKDRLRFLVTRALVRTVLSRYAPLGPKEWVFTSNRYGRPDIAPFHQLDTRISFNISHTSEIVALAITAGQEVGIDVERFAGRHAMLDIANCYFAASELEEINALQTKERTRRFFEYWTLKESYIKARGLGMSIPFNQFAFQLVRRHRIKVDITSQLQDSAAFWRFWLFQPDTAHLLALCVRANGPMQKIRSRRTIPLLSEQTLFLYPERISDS